ncbi:MAG TPA: SLBB domain-containing protein [Terriglobales bacterium]|nr:SLBB domain-containing protein [Terriglobales bacterium]
MHLFRSPRLFRRATRTSIAVLAIAIATAAAQAQSAEPLKNGPDLTAGQMEARATVSYSPDIIIQVLRQYPALALQVKKLLVEKAYEQGRMLDPEDLRDDVLFRLIREDENIRVMATREIEDRGYIKLQPTVQEQQAQAARMQSRQQLEAGRIPGNGRVPSTSPRGNGSGDDQFPESPSGQPQPRPSVPSDQQPQRRVDRALVESDTPSMAPISPDQLPQLFSGGTIGGVTPASSMEREGLAAQASRNPASLANVAGMQQQLAAGSAPSVVDTEPPQQAALEVRPRPATGAYASPSYERPSIRRQPNPYADVPSLYDLYSQVQRHNPALDRFGADIFTNGTGNLDELPMDLPVGPEYVIGPGDGLKIEIWGSISQRLIRNVDREGRVALPEVGTVMVAGKTLGDVQRQIQGVLRSQFREVQADVSLARLRTVRIYVVGDVRRPGAYDISSLSTPLNALYAAGGPTARGSLRVLKHYRGKQLVQEIDLYDLLLHGVRADIIAFQPGDTILVPPIGPQVTVEGMVRRPAIYELNKDNNLAQVLELAGGVLPSGTLRHIEVQRVQAHDKRGMLSLDIPETNDQTTTLRAMEQFVVQDGDHIRISPILPYSEKTVYLDGHVFHPGKYAYRQGMTVAELIGDYHALLPEPSRRHAEIIRLHSPDFTPEVLTFNLGDAMAGKGEVPVLQPFDTVRIFGRFDFEDAPRITIAGEVRDPGDHLTNGETHVSDAVYLAGGATVDASLADAQIFRRDGATSRVISINLAKALSGDQVQNVLLQPKDRLIIHANLAKLDPSRVTIEGEVANPGKYVLGKDLTAAQLVRLAGGLKRGAYTQSADLTRYVIQNGTRVLGDHEEVPIGRALSGEADTDVRLRDGDVLTIRQLTGWKDVGASVTLRGEVGHPGTYGIRDGERLSSVLERAGGITLGGYARGAMLMRESVRIIQERGRQDLIHRMELEQGNLKDVALQQYQLTVDTLKNTPVAGRVVIHISRDISAWKDTPNDLELRAGDVLVVPKEGPTIIVSGEVNNPTSISYRPGRSAEWYLSQAGGPTPLANKKGTFVILADGSVLGGSSGAWWKGNALSTALHPGDTVVVPQRGIGGVNWKNIFQVAQIASSLAVTFRVLANY